MLAKDSKVFEWCMQAFQQRQFQLTNLLVTLLNENHEPLKTWNVVNAWPKKWSVSDFNAEANAIVIETLELKYNYFTIR
jgi:phage tail-like protein